MWCTTTTKASEEENNFEEAIEGASKFL